MFTFLGMVIYAGIDVKQQLHVAYFATFMMTWYVSLWCLLYPLPAWPAKSSPSLSNLYPPSLEPNLILSRGTSAPSVLLDVWYNNNIAHEGRRVVLTSFGVPLANLMGVVSSNIFQNKDGKATLSSYVLYLSSTTAYSYQHETPP